MEKVVVLMSTYNGEKYIEEQIDSILSQRGVEIQLHIRDDGSSDQTVTILRRYEAKHRNVFLYIGEKNLGSCGSFFELMSKEYEGDYYALADQDDVWDDDKILSAIELLKTLPCNKPALYYSNLRIVDRDLKYIRESHHKPMIPGAKYSYLSDVFVTGCTAVFNKELQKIAVDIKPKKFSMHDTWLYVVASIYGNCIYDFKSHMSYRQHGENVVGTRKRIVSFESCKRELNNLFNRNSQPRLQCAQEIIKQFDGKLDDETRKKILEIVNYKKSFWTTIKLAFDNDYNSDNLYRTIRFRINVLLRKA